MFIESNKIELKSKYTDQIVKEIVAFINADGGKIYIGISDDGTVCGAQKIDESLVSIRRIMPYTRWRPLRSRKFSLENRWER